MIATQPESATSGGGKLSFVIVGTQRTGSTLIRTYLDSHPDIRCFGELFAQKDERAHSYAQFVARSVSNRLLHHVYKKRLVYRYLDELPAGEHAKRLGFKVMYNQVQRPRRGFPMLVDYIGDRRLKVLHVVRENVLKMAVSRVRAWSTGIWHSDSKRVARPGKVEMEADKLLAILRALKQLEQQWRVRLGEYQTLEISYEAFVKDQAEVTARILGFIDVDSAPSLGSPLKKVTPDRLDEVVTNFDEVRAALKGTEFEWCLDDQ